MTSPTITAAICTRHRPLQLARALDSLLAQSAAPAEIIVVDNAPSDDATARLVTERFSGVRYLREPVPGLDFARNRALGEAAGEIVAFLDDDAVADRDWCRALKRVFESAPDVAVCTGRVEPLMLASPGQLLFELNGGFSRGSRRIRLPDHAAKRLHGWPAPLIAWAISVGCGCAYAVRRSAALQLGGFDEALDLGGALPGGETTISSGARCSPAGESNTSRRPWPGTNIVARPMPRTIRSSGINEPYSPFCASRYRSPLSGAGCLCWRI